MATAAATQPRRRLKISRITLRENIQGYLWISPWLLGFLIFVFGPMLASFNFSFTNYRIINDVKYIGLDNYVYAFTEDDLFWPSLAKTFTFMLVSVPIGLLGSLLLAMLLNQRLRGETVFRTFFFLPSLTPLAAAAILWVWILHPEAGMVNYLLSLIGIEGPAWLGSSRWALPSIVMITLWTSIGGGRMIIFLAALQGVPAELYEASEIDGAGSWSKFRHITLPMISPALFFNTILGIIAALQVFTTAFITTRGGPGRATWFYALHIYTNAFEYFDMGYASALAIILFVILLVFTIVQLRLSDKWVFYSGG
ncbi:MAG: sugar ABC transporter permease [Caldilineaceae bacterium]|nr:sugar ABC transporter permease [Caldilineaceae bacterium]